PIALDGQPSFGTDMGRADGAAGEGHLGRSQFVERLSHSQAVIVVGRSDPCSLAGELADMQMFADGKIDLCCSSHPRLGLRGDLSDRGRKPKKPECCHVEAKLMGSPRAAEPPRLRRKQGLAPRCQYARERALQGSDANPVAGDGAVEVRYRRPIAQEPE